MARAAHRLLTYDDLLALPDDGLRHELIDGEHFVSPAPSIKHQTVSMNLSLALGAFVKRHGSGRLFAAPCDVVFTPTDVVEPDLLFVSRERLAILTERNLEGAPDLVIEILSPSSRHRDEALKLRLYGRMGVGEYWIVDPLAEAVTVHRRHHGALRVTGELSAASGDVLTTPLLPGLAVPLAEVFA